MQHCPGPARGSASKRGSAAAGGKIIGDAGCGAGAGHYGASADYQTLYRQFGITAAAVAAAAWDSVHDAQDKARDAVTGRGD